MGAPRWKLFKPALLTLLVCCLASSQISDQQIQDRLAKHADLFKMGTSDWPRLEDQKPDAQGTINYRAYIIGDYMARDAAITPAQELAALAAHADVIVSGTTVKRFSAANSFHTALYSDWIANVTKVYKRSPLIQAEAGDQITVTRAGGDMTLQGHRVIYTDPTFPEFALGHEYVFYLEAHTDTSSFIALDGGTFDMTGSAPLLIVDPRDPTSLRAFASFSKADFLTAVERSAIQ